ncbi:galectin-related protein-like [Gigantopelta aegis]|uniref:galectin-related protein-like n=1 Tax=Gigantopelta aegis TaxID=1735272 RepID=UPI001B88D03E|nr:galectin-related protein-like [Gigantopelta aegis]
MNLAHGDNVPFLLSIRIKEGIVARNSILNTLYGKEDRTIPYFPFVVGIPFNLTILVTDSAFELYVDETNFVSRASSYNIALINELNIWKGCLLHSVKFIY